MSIDWFTFTAQIINFLVLVWLLSHFLYKPIVNAMNDRQARIAAEHEQALSAKRDADSAAAAFQQKTEELAHAKDELLAE
ncbi:MAG: F0F1 ATP synthase subunit B, partial [Planctomyces sp.]|nr:F0F1 ATP synthase subunit B [Planctomyces sp.]